MTSDSPEMDVTAEGIVGDMQAVIAGLGGKYPRPDFHRLDVRHARHTKQGGSCDLPPHDRRDRERPYMNYPGFTG